MDQTMPMSSFLIVSNLEIFLVFLSPSTYNYQAIFCQINSLPLLLLVFFSHDQTILGKFLLYFIH